MESHRASGWSRDMKYLGVAVLGVGVLGVAVLGTAVLGIAVLGTAVLQHQYEITPNTALVQAPLPTGLIKAWSRIRHHDGQGT